MKAARTRSYSPSTTRSSRGGKLGKVANARPGTSQSSVGHLGADSTGLWLIQRVGGTALPNSTVPWGLLHGRGDRKAKQSPILEPW